MSRYLELDITTNIDFFASQSVTARMKISRLGAALGLSRLAHGYFLDDSCDTVGLSDYVKKAMASNHKISTAAVVAMDRFRRDPAGKRDEAGQAEETALANFLGLLTADGRPNPKADGWNDAVAVLSWIRTQTLPGGDEPGSPQPNPGAVRGSRGEPLRYGALGVEDVVVFCDYTRFVEGKFKPENAYDQHTGRDCAMTQGWKDAQDIDLATNSLRFAWAHCSARNKKTRETSDLDYPNQVQLNPGLPKFWDRPGFGRQVLDDLVPELCTDTQPKPLNKLFRNLDHQLFHEITHTYPGFRVHDKGGYGWTKAILASHEYGYKNADNLALYASTTWLARAEIAMTFDKDANCKVINGDL